MPAWILRQTTASRSTNSSTLGSMSSGGSRPARVSVARPCGDAPNTSVNSPGWTPSPATSLMGVNGLLIMREPREVEAAPTAPVPHPARRRLGACRGGKRC